VKTVVVKKNKTFVFPFEKERIFQDFLDINKIVDAVQDRLTNSVDFSVLDEYYHLLKVPRGSKTFYYHRTCVCEDGVIKQKRWFGRVGTEKAEKELREWMKRKKWAEKALELQEDIEEAKSYLLIAQSRLKRVLDELSNVSLEGEGV